MCNFVSSRERLEKVEFYGTGRIMSIELMGKLRAVAGTRRKPRRVGGE
jgi:hypothetical protein